MGEQVVIKVLTKGRKLRCMPRTFAYDDTFVFTDDPASRRYDWLVVYDEMPEEVEVLACPRANTIFATCEPVSIKSYSRAFTRQFGHLLTNRPPAAERHPHWHLGRGYYQWFVDRDLRECRETVLPPKSRLISAVCSSKRMRHTLHDARFRLVEALAAAIPEMAWYGHGVRGFARKYEVLDPYRYHVVVENHLAPHHWTEKLADAFLCECLPLYAGAPDLAEDFPAESFIALPIDDPAAALEIVRRAIADGEYERRREAVLAAKRLILQRYNFWAQVVEVIRNAAPAAGATPAGERLFARKALRRRNLGAALEEGWMHARRALGLVPSVGW